LGRWLAEARRDEFTIEFALLLGGQQRVNLEIRGVEDLAALRYEVAMGRVNLLSRLLHHVADLLPLRRCQLEHARHPKQRPLARQVDVAADIPHGRTKRSKDEACQKGDRDYQ
jgi:hypothetical protein